VSDDDEGVLEDIEEGREPRSTRFNNILPTSTSSSSFFRINGLPNFF